MKKSFYLLLLIITSCNVTQQSDNQILDSSTLSTNIPISAEILKHDLISIEAKTPLNYLSLTGGLSLTPQQKQVRRSGFLRSAKYEDDGATIDAYIKNSASLASYKDITVRIFYYSATKSVISTEDRIIYNYYTPGKIEPITLKVYPPLETNNFDLKLIKALSIN